MNKGNEKKTILRAGIIGDALAPNFNTAPANQMRLLSEKLNAPVLTINNLGLLPFKKMGKYLIVNARFLREERPNRFLSLMNGGLLYSLVKLFERRYDVIYLAGGINSGFLPRLNLTKCVLIINSLPLTPEDGIAINFSMTYASRLRAIIAQSRRVKERLISLGAKPEKIYLVYPWVDTEKFKYSSPPDSGEFRILSASAPDSESEKADSFKEKGIDLLLESFAGFLQNHRSSLCLLWRGKYTKRLYEKIKTLDLEKHIKVYDKVADMPAQYAQAHVTAIPFLSLRGSPELPLSAIESITSGRPVVTTDVPEISEIVRNYKCGSTAKPLKEDFMSALIECRQNYRAYQSNCQRAASELFSLSMDTLLSTGISSGKS